MSLHNARQNDRRIRRKLKGRKGKRHSRPWEHGCRCSYCVAGWTVYKKAKQSPAPEKDTGEPEDL